MSPARTDAAGQLGRIASVSFAGFAGRLEIEEIESRSWASITFSGEQHRLRLRLEGEGAAAAADAFLDGLSEREFDLAGHILADIAPVSDERDESGSVVRLGIEALTVEAS